MIARLSVRPAAAAERAALEALQRRASLALADHREALLAQPDAIEFPAAHIAGTLVAELDGKAAGFAVVLRRDDGDAELEGLFVEPDLWRLGIGTGLIEQAERVASASGARRLHVISDRRGKDFYLARGFEVAGEAATRFGPALAMRKSLRRP